MIKIDESGAWEIEPISARESASIFRTDDDRFGYVRYNDAPLEHFYGMLDDDGSLTSFGPVRGPALPEPGQPGIALAIPPAALLPVIVVTRLAFNDGYSRSHVLIAGNRRASMPINALTVASIALGRLAVRNLTPVGDAASV